MTPLLPALTDYLRETTNSLLIHAVQIALFWDELDPAVRQRHSQVIALLFTIDSGRTSTANRDAARLALAEIIAETM